EKVAQFLDKVPETTVAVFNDGEVDQRTTYFKGMTKQAKVKAVKYGKLNLPQLQNWVKKQVQTLGGTIEPAALARLIDLAGDDQWRLEQEIQKLVNYQTAVTPESVKL